MTMPLSPAIQKLETRMAAADSLLCIGLDPQLDLIPAHFQHDPDPLFAFCREVIDRTAPFACAFKPNTAFFEAHGAHGWSQLAQVFAHLCQAHPTHFTICDAKRADIGSTNRGYVTAVFDGLNADAVTLHPYLGAEALEPFLARQDKASILLCRTSNPGAAELQDLDAGGQPLWEHIARRVANSWNTRGNCMLVVGATWPAEMRRIRAIAPAMTFLVPGIGAQGGDLEATLHAGLRPDRKGLILSSSRAILYAPDPAAAAQTTRDTIRHAIQTSAPERLHAS